MKSTLLSPFLLSLALFLSAVSAVSASPTLVFPALNTIRPLVPVRAASIELVTDSYASKSDTLHADLSSCYTADSCWLGRLRTSASPLCFRAVPFKRLASGKVVTEAAMGGASAAPKSREECSQENDEYPDLATAVAAAALLSHSASVAVVFPRPPEGDVLMDVPDHVTIVPANLRSTVYIVGHGPELSRISGGVTVSPVGLLHAKAGKAGEKATREVAEGLKGFFDAALGKMLLYGFERPQYEEEVAQNPKFKASKVYGAEHLLRLLVKLPAILKESNIPEEKVKVITDKVNELFKFMQKNGTAIFSPEYEPATKEYLSKLPS